MELRHCSTCTLPKPIGEFYKKHDGRKIRSDCKECFKKLMPPRSKAHYQRNREAYYERRRAARTACARFIRQYKVDHPTCADCGKDHPYWRLDFDHVRGKHRNLSAIASLCWSPPRILAEIARCDVVCSNCHRDRTQHRRARHESNVHP